MTVPEVLLLTAEPRRLGTAEPLPAQVATRDGSVWGAVDAPLEDGLTLHLGQDLADFCRFPEVDAALDAWWSALRLREGVPVVIALPFAALPHGAQAMRRWATRRLRQPLLIVAECLLPLLEALPHLSVPGDVEVVGPSGKLHVQVSEGRIDVLGRQGEASRQVAVGDGHVALAEALFTGPARPVRLGVRPEWSLVEAGSRRPLLSLRLAQRMCHRSIHVAPGPDLEVLCSLGPRPADRARVARLETPAGRVDLRLTPRGGRIRAFPGEFLEFPVPGLVS